jgi:Cof subfamily protein (haloacid dehalogenase superfamily)
MKDIKLVFSDVDNTLVSYDNPFSDTLYQAIELLNKNNIEFVMCSGRPTMNLVEVANRYNQQGLKLNYVVGFNGAEIYDLNNNKVISSKALTQNDVIKITEVLETLNIDYLTYNEDKIYATDVNNEFAKKERDLTELEVLPQTHKLSSPKILGLVDPSIMDVTLNAVKNALPEYFVVSSTAYFIEITAYGVSKGTGLEQMAEILAVNINPDVMCCGDAGNDIAMFEICDHAVAVANAVDEIKNHASIIVESATDNGIAKYIIDKLN